MKRVFIFDLDDTLGRKTPSFPAVSRENGKILRELVDTDHLLCIATSRPRSLTYRGMAYAGLSKEEVDRMFPVQVLEDGLIARVGSEVVFNALDVADASFRDVRDAFYDARASRFFEENGFLLFPSCEVEYNGIGFRLIDYHGNDCGLLESGDTLIPLFRQDNEVKQVYKAAHGFLGGDLRRLEPIFKQVGELTEEHLSQRFSGWRKVAYAYVWQDAIDLYPKLPDFGDDVSIKGVGLDLALRRFDLPVDSTRVYVCGDGKNDIQMVRWVASRFSRYHVVCPSNVSRDLRQVLVDGRYVHTVLSEDCNRFAEGLKRIVESE